MQWTLIDLLKVGIIDRQNEAIEIYFAMTWAKGGILTVEGMKCAGFITPSVKDYLAPLVSASILNSATL